MLTRLGGARVFLATGFTDLRKSYDGLGALVEGTFGKDARSGDLFVFFNRRGSQVRVLYWDRDGYCIWMKRLEAGTFRRTQTTSGNALMEVDAAELVMLLEGVEASAVTRRKRYQDPRRKVHDDSTSLLLS